MCEVLIQFCKSSSIAWCISPFRKRDGATGTNCLGSDFDYAEYTFGKYGIRRIKANKRKAFYT
jgi:hypothetical protein